MDASVMDFRKYSAVALFGKARTSTSAKRKQNTNRITTYSTATTLGSFSTYQYNKDEVEPWNLIEWPPYILQNIYREWAMFYVYKHQLRRAGQYFDKTLEINPNDSKALYNRSLCKRYQADVEGAYLDSLRATFMQTDNATVDLEYATTLYELNKFEDAKVSLHQFMRKYHGAQNNRTRPFANKINIITENFRDSLGTTLRPFILKTESLFPKILAELDFLKIVDDRPLWKRLREMDKCDVQSVLEQEELLLPALEIARRKRAFKIFNQIYFNKAWIDILFLKELRDNPSLVIPQAKFETPELQDLVCGRYQIIKKLFKMLHTRSPLYNEIFKRQPNKKMMEQARARHLFHVQNQTRRNMYKILRGIRRLRAKGDRGRLAMYVEEVMGDYVVLKNLRVMPWKFEFVNEVYNMLGLAFTDSFAITKATMMENPADRLYAMLNLESDWHVEPPVHVFGQRKTFQQHNDVANERYRRLVARLEKRIRFSRYAIEKAYLLHTLANTHLKQSRFEECCSLARKGADMSKSCGSHLWAFLNVMLIVKAHVSVSKVERCKGALTEARAIVPYLRSKRLMHFVDMCDNLNDTDLALKKHTQSLESLLRKPKLKASVSGRRSYAVGSQQISRRTSSTDQLISNTD